MTGERGYMPFMKIPADHSLGNMNTLGLVLLNDTTTGYARTNIGFRFQSTDGTLDRQ